MNLKCPYCGCCYEISRDSLKEPIGHEKLGYGWWLRCYKCHKKWWLRNSIVEGQMNSPLRADRDAKIKKLSTLLGKKPQKKVFVFSKIIKYVIFLILMLSAYVIYQEKETFRSFLLTKAQKISQRVSKKVTMTDVKYTVGSGNITVSGDITNEDQIIAKVDGVKIIIFDGESKITAWEVQLDEKTLLPEQKVHFSTIKPLPTEIREMRVEVSVF